MDNKLKADEVALLIRARKLLKEKGLPKDIDVSGICEAAGVSRKTGYEWESRLTKTDELVLSLEQENEELKKKHAELAALYKEVRFENEGRKAAWFIHGVDKLIAGKKNTSAPPKKLAP
jgi:hypothetical protein